MNIKYLTITDEEMHKVRLTDEELVELAAYDLQSNARALLELSVSLRKGMKEGQWMLDVFRYLNETQSTATGLTYADLQRIYSEQFGSKENESE